MKTYVIIPSDKSPIGLVRKVKADYLKIETWYITFYERRKFWPSDVVVARLRSLYIDDIVVEENIVEVNHDPEI